MVHKTKKSSRLSSFSFWGPCYQNQTVNKGSHSYFETSLAPQSKTFPAIIPSMREICRCSHGSASNSLSLLESRRSAASFSSCFTCTLKGRKINVWHLKKRRETSACPKRRENIPLPINTAGKNAPLVEGGKHVSSNRRGNKRQWTQEISGNERSSIEQVSIEFRK